MNENELKTYRAEDRNGVEMGRCQAPGPIAAQMALIARGAIKLGGPSFWIIEAKP